jgi:16S rRNA G966 N2-methylase RsmD
VSYPGGKATQGVFQAIINQMPPHQTYIEAFLGAGAIMRHKKSAPCSIGIDVDEHVLAKHWSGPRDTCPTDQVLGQRLTIVHADAIEWLATHDWEGNELVYLDPPYPMATRSTQRSYYAHELSDDDHRRLLDTIKTIPAMVMISSYPNDLYSQALAGWRTLTFKGNTHGGPSVEKLWMNYPKPTALHDPRYIGSNYRERERIRKQQRRWVDRLARMSVLQRQALLAALDEAEIAHRQK